MKNLEKVSAYIAHAKGSRKELPKMTILYGKTGTGKSRYCFEQYDGSKAYWVPPPAKGTVWWGMYRCQDVCIFDDFHDGWFPLTMLLRLMDRYPVQVAPKGGQVPFNSKEMVFTSNVDPKKWYNNYKGKGEHKKALERRIREYCKVYDCSDVNGEFTKVERDMTAFVFDEPDQWHAGGNTDGNRWNNRF